MAKPVIWTVDDDPDVLRALERDLRRQYGNRYRVMAADSGAGALESVKQLKLRNDPVALFLVDQRMPHMSGVEFLEAALQIYPDARRALLTAYADTDAAIRAINSVKIDHYLMKPWDPPEEHLYGVVDDLLDDWQASFRPPFEGIRIVGHRWSPRFSQILTKGVRLVICDLRRQRSDPEGRAALLASRAPRGSPGGPRRAGSLGSYNWDRPPGPWRRRTNRRRYSGS